MGVALRRLDLGVSEQPLNDVEGDPTVHEIAGKGVPEIVETYARQISSPADAIPGVEEGGRRASRSRGREKVGVAWLPVDGADEVEGGGIEADVARLAALRDGHEEGATLPVDPLPAGLCNLVASCAGQEKEHDGAACNHVLFLGDRSEETLCLDICEETLAMRSMGERNAHCRVLVSGWQQLPSTSEVEDVS